MQRLQSAVTTLRTHSVRRKAVKQAARNHGNQMAGSKVKLLFPGSSPLQANRATAVLALQVVVSTVSCRTF